MQRVYEWKAYNLTPGDLVISWQRKTRVPMRQLPSEMMEGYHQKSAAVILSRKRAPDEERSHKGRRTKCYEKEKSEQA